MISIDNVSEQTREKISSIRWDRFIEKHEGPWDWEYLIDRKGLPDEMIKHFPDYDPIAETPEFIEIGSYDVLLPIGRNHHPKITILKYFFSQDLGKLVIYLKDETYDEGMYAGYVAICDFILPENFYVATFYHEWYITDYDEKFK